MKKIIILTTILLTLSSFSSPIETHSMKSVFDGVKAQLKKHSAHELLLVMDIDNTLLTSNHDLNSYGWTRWQVNLINERAAEAITHNFEEFYKIQNILYALGKMHLPEEIIASEIKLLQKQGVTIIALTSRGPKMRSSTERELTANNINLQNSGFSGIPGFFTLKYGKGRDVSFQHGVFMTAGQHKGLMLKGLLERLDRSFKSIVFVDDTTKHTLHMSETFKNMGDDLLSFRYGQMDARVEKFLKGDKSRVTQQWLKLKNIWSEIFNW